MYPIIDWSSYPPGGTGSQVKWLQFGPGRFSREQGSLSSVAADTPSNWGRNVQLRVRDLVTNCLEVLAEFHEYTVSVRRERTLLILLVCLFFPLGSVFARPAMDSSLETFQKQFLPQGRRRRVGGTSPQGTLRSYRGGVKWGWRSCSGP